MRSSASPAPTATPANILPYDSTLTFVLDGTISSASSKAGDVVPAHLQDDLIVNGQLVAAARTTVMIRVLDAKPATNPDIYGLVDIAFGSLTLSNGQSLPLRTQATRLEVNVSAGHQSTVDLEDTVTDMFTPGILFHILRKGRDFTLEPGATIRARTEAAVVVAPNGAVALRTPMPIVLEESTPLASFKAAPLATPNPSFQGQVVVPTHSPGPGAGTPTPCPTEGCF
jgi:hypothetical protein